MTSNAHIQHCPNPNPYLHTEQYYILIMISHFIQALIITTSCQDESAIYLVVVLRKGPDFYLTFTDGGTSLKMQMAFSFLGGQDGDWLDLFM